MSLEAPDKHQQSTQIEVSPNRRPAVPLGGLDAKPSVQPHGSHHSYRKADNHIPARLHLLGYRRDERQGSRRGTSQ